MTAMRYEEWAAGVPEAITGDVLWKVEAYRLGVFISEISWHDMNVLWKDPRTRDLADQLYRATCSISANLAEGYGHSTGKNRARYFEYSLGSAREARDWYYKSRHVLGDEISLHRIKFVTSIIRLLITMIPQQRANGSLRDEKGVYLTSVDAPTNSSDSICYAEIPLL